MSHSYRFRTVLGYGLLLIACIGFGFWFRTNGDSVPKSLANLPTISTPASIDFGEVGLGRHNVEFRLENRGSLPLEVGQFQVPCGCMVLGGGDATPLAADRSFVIPPGRFRVMTLDLTVQESTTPEVRHHLRFATNDPNRKLVEVPVRDSVRGRLGARPSVVNLGNRLAGTEAVAQVSIRDHEFDPPRRIGNILSSDPSRIDVRRGTVPSSPSDPRLVEQLELRVTFSGRGSFQESIRVMDEANRNVLVVIPVFGTAELPFSCSPSSLSLPRLVSGKREFTTRLVCRSFDRRPFELTILEHPLLTSRFKDDANSESTKVVEIEVEEAKLTPSREVTTNLMLRFRQGSNSTEVSVPVRIGGGE